jgi:hypothetical protein
MVKVKQTTFYPGGNCLSACFASIFEKDINDIPDFIDMKDFWDQVIEYLDSIGYEYNGLIRFNKEYDRYIKDGYYIVMGKSERGCNHVCIYKESKLVFDPHPSDLGLMCEDWILDIGKKDIV